jgi:endonuclease/exonuclease/phosphatase family metal-dependent hydrolase
MRDTLQASGLISARRGFGILPSWPTQRPVLVIPIDHVLVSSEIGVVDFRVGKGTGSDHLPVTVDLVLP